MEISNILKYFTPPVSVCVCLCVYYLSHSPLLSTRVIVVGSGTGCWGGYVLSLSLVFNVDRSRRRIYFFLYVGLSENRNIYKN